MLTKRELCEQVVAHNKDTPIHACSHLAIAKEYLGQLTIEEMEYSTQRGGTIPGYIIGMSFRELLDLLPE